MLIILRVILIRHLTFSIAENHSVFHSLVDTALPSHTTFVEGPNSTDAAKEEHLVPSNEKTITS